MAWHQYAPAANADVIAHGPDARPAPNSRRSFDSLAGLDGLVARLNPAGVDLISSDNTELDGEPSGWRFGLSLCEFRRGDVTVQREQAEVYQEDGFIAFVNESFQEWYIREERVLEHMIVLQTPPSMRQSGIASPLELRLDLRGDLCPVVGSCGKSMVLYDRMAVPVLSYSGLRAWDSNGTEIGATLQSTGHVVSIVLEDSNAQYPLTIDPLIGILRARIAPPDLVLGSNFGTAMSLDGNRLVVTSTGFFSGGPRGAAYVYEQVNSKWLRTARLASSAVLDDHYGGAVSVSGDTIAVSATGASDHGPASGAVFIFARVGNQWIQQGRLIASDGIASATFGNSLSLQQDRLVVGAMFDDDLGPNSGSVYVFERAGTTWSQVAKLLPSNGQQGFWFGTSVSAEGDMIVVGAQNAPGGGAVYVFREAGGAWSQEAIIPGYPYSAGYFGYSVATSNGRIVVGDPAARRAHLFQNLGVNWTLETTLMPISPQPNSWFGHALDIVNEQVLIGAPSSAPLGAAYAFTRVSGSWSQTAEFTSLNTSPFGAMGYSVALNGSVYCVGEPLDSLMGWDSGSAYVFDVVEAYTTYCTAKVNSLGCSPTVAVQGVASATAAQGMVISCSQVLNNTPGLLLYTTAGRSSTPFQGGLLCLNSPIRRTPARTAGGSPAPAVDCTGTFSIDMNAFARGSLGGQPIPELSIVGTVVQCQWWGRDQGLPPPFNSMLSNAAEYTVAQ